MNDDEHQISGVNWSFFGILAAIVILVGATTYFLLPSLISQTDTGVTIVKAIEGPIKVKPTEPGGKAVGHQDLLVVDILKGGTKADNQTESLRPSAPSPEPPPVNVIQDPTPKIIDNLGKSESMTSSLQNAAVSAGPKKTRGAEGKNKQIGDAPKDNSLTLNKKTSADDESRKNLASKEDTIKQRPVSKLNAPVVVIEGNTPLYMIQLAAFRNPEKASEMANILSQKHQSRLKDVKLKTMKFDTGSNGIFHRIVSIPLPRQDADNICGILRRSGQDCFLRKSATISP